MQSFRAILKHEISLNQVFPTYHNIPVTMDVFPLNLFFTLPFFEQVQFAMNVELVRSIIMHCDSDYNPNPSLKPIVSRNLYLSISSVDRIAMLLRIETLPTPIIIFPSATKHFYSYRQDMMKVKLASS